MALTISVLPASTRAGKETIRALLASAGNHVVRGFYRDLAKAPAEYTANPNFEALEGDVSSGQGLTFAGSDALIYIVPPTYDDSDEVEYATRTANYVKNALANAPSVKKLVLQSAMGAQNDSGIVSIYPYRITRHIY